MPAPRPSPIAIDLPIGVPSYGTVLAGKYRIESLLGAGGMGFVVAATHIHLQERVAVKLLHPEMVTRRGAVERFLREARVAMKLRGEHVVRVLDVGIDLEIPYLVMECLDGSDLGTVLRDAGRLETTSAIDYVLQACEAIAEAHAAGVVHRDLKPANLFLTRRIDGSPCIKVLDFGVSKLLDASPSDDLETTAPPSTRELDGDLTELGVATTVGAERGGVTRSRMMLGSPRYMAPEQLRSARDVDARADLWALGVILFELLSGKPPFAEESLAALNVAITERDVPRLRGVPAALEAVVRRCLAKDREARWTDARSLAAALAPFASAEGRVTAERIARMMRRLGEIRMARGIAPSFASAIEVAPGVARWSRSLPRAALLLSFLALPLAWLSLRAKNTPHANAAPESSVAAAVASDDVAPVAPYSVPAAVSTPAVTMTSPPPEIATPKPVRAPRPAAAKDATTRERAAATASARASSSASTPPAADDRPDPLKFDAGFLFDRRK